MRNLKKLLAVIVAICVLATFTVPAFAETKSPATVAEELGVIKGTGDGVTADYLATQPDRLQGAIMFLRLKGLEDDAIAFTGTDNFADVAGLNATNKAILAYLKAHPELGFGGIGGNKFGATLKMEAKQYYKVMLNALGYTYGTDDTADFTWNTVMSFAAGKGLVKLNDVTKFTVNDLCVGTVEALKATIKGGTQTLIAKLVGDGNIAADKAASTGLFVASEVALTVVSATADNFKTAKFVFNKELNADTVKAANFVGSSDAQLLADKKTVVVVLGTAKTAQSSTADITVKDVKAADGTTIAETKKTVTFVDTTIPVVTGAVALNGKTVVISTSEPMTPYDFSFNSIFSNIKIDGITAVATSVCDPVKNTITLTLNTALKVGDHKISITDMKDYAGYVAVAQEFSFSVAEDVTAPSIVSAKYVANDKVEVTFSEDLGLVGSFWVNDDVANAAPVGTSKSVYTLTMTTKKLDIGATVEVRIAYQGQKDVMGNEVKDKVTFMGLKVSDDTTLPTVTAALNAGNELVLTFSKNMLTNVGTVKILDKDSKQIGSVNLSSASWDGLTVAKFNANAFAAGVLSGTDAKDIKVKVSDAKDATVRNNALVETVIDLKALDTNAPTVKGSYTVAHGATSADDTITFYFTEPMNPDTLKNLSNYVVATTGSALGSKVSLAAYGSAASFSSISSDGKSVTIKVTNIYAADSEVFSVYALKDIAGNMLTTGSVSKALTTAPDILNVTATAINKIEVLYTQDIGSADRNAYIVYEDGVHATPAAIVIDAAVDGAKVTLTLDRGLATSTDKTFLAYKDNKLVKNFYGVEAATHAAIQADDKINPTVSITTTGSGIILTFSEAVNTTASTLISELIITKGGAPVTVTTGAVSIAVDNKSATITLEALTDYVVQFFPRGTQDAATNPVDKLDAKTYTTK